MFGASSHSYCPVFLSQNFTVLALTFRSTVHLLLILKYGVRGGLRFIPNGCPIVRTAFDEKNRVPFY